MTNPYQADDKLENEVLFGLLTYKPFARRFSQKKVRPEIFIGQNREKKRQLVRIVGNYYNQYFDCMPLDLLVDAVQREAAESTEDAGVDQAATTVVLKAAMSTQASLDGMEHKLDLMLETFKCYSFVDVMKEAGTRFMVCRFKHKKHELCQSCPLTFECQGLQRSPSTSFADRLYHMTYLRFQKSKEAAGTLKIETNDVVQNFDASWKRYEERERRALEGGASYVPGVPTPWPLLTRKIGGWMPTRMYGIFAERKTGKTTVLTNCTDAGILSGKNVLFCHMEDRAPEMVDKFLVSVSGVSQLNYMLGSLSEQEKNLAMIRVREYQAAANAGKIGKFISCYAPLRRIGLMNVQEKLEESINQGTSIDLVLFDHLHIADLGMSAAKGFDKTQRLLEFAEGFKELAQVFEVPVILAGQLKTSGDRKGKSRWSDEIEDVFDGVFHLEDHDGRMKFVKKYGRFFGDVEVLLEDYRDRVSLTQSPEQDYDIIDDSEIDMSPSEFLKARES